MTSRDRILNAIKLNKPAELYHADYAVPDHTADLPGERYRASLEKNGGVFFKARTLDDVARILANAFPDGAVTVSMVGGIAGSRTLHPSDDPHALADVDVAVVRGVVGVAENAAIWLSEKEIVQRVLPFITQHIVIVLDEADIVPSMHEAYARINIRESGYGVFVAAPSKTADIEQSLVIGAHGPRSLTVVLMC